jgi:hypothetical protein
MDNDSRLRQDIVLSSIILLQIFRHLKQNPTSFALNLLNGIHCEDGLIRIINTQEIREVQSTINRIFPERNIAADPRSIRRHAGMALFDMVLLGNYILMRELKVEINGRIEFIPADAQVRATRTLTPMHDLILILEDLCEDNLSTDVLEASDNLFLQQVGMSSLHQTRATDRLDLKKRLSPRALRSLDKRPSREMREEYSVLEAKATAVRSSFLADPNNSQFIPRKKVLNILELDRLLERPSIFHCK